jgi:GT2 family glycosyltransferase/glycosyltransferase involved in cell wall biosynthesis
MRAAFFGTYNRGHSANRIAVTAVEAAGYEVVEIHDPLWERTRDKHAGYFSPASLVRLGFEWLGSARRLSRAWRRSGGAAVAVVGFNGQLDVLLLRLLGLRYGPRIVFAPLVSLTETLVDDRRVYDSGSLAGRMLRLLDRATCRAADVVVVDTEEHRRYFVDELGVDPSRLLVCHLGADPAVFLEPAPVPEPEAEVAQPPDEGEVRPGRPGRFLVKLPYTLKAQPERASPAEEGKLDVLWFGQYLPLHGLDVIVDAVGRLALRDELRTKLRFTFIGTGEERVRIERELRTTRADLRFTDWVPYEELAARIARADIVFGIFGGSRKARMVIPNKVYEAAAVGRAVVTADTPAVREVFEDGTDVVLCGADGLELANAVARLAGDEELRERLGAAARRLMLERFSAEALGRSWSVALAGPDAPVLRRMEESAAAARVAAVVLSFQDAHRTLECLRSLAADGYPALDVLVVDNASAPEQRALLAEGIETAAGSLDVETLWLDRNLGYAGANNVAMKHLFGRGCDYVLLLNSDTLVAPGSIAALVRAARANRMAGPLGPRVSEEKPGGEPTSLGERYTAATLWAPRSLLRVRAQRQHPYPVSGVTGCALFVPRALFERVGGFDESLFAYYEEVDLCLRAKEAGFAPTVVPDAEVGHAGSRGFGSGMTPLAAWLKARNLYLVGMRRVRSAPRIVFVFGYHGLVALSSIAYQLRGRRDVAAAMTDGMRAGLRGSTGPPPESLFLQSGYGQSGTDPDLSDLTTVYAKADARASSPGDSAPGSHARESGDSRPATDSTSERRDEPKPTVTDPGSDE